MLNKVFVTQAGPEGTINVPPDFAAELELKEGDWLALEIKGLHLEVRTRNPAGGKLTRPIPMHINGPLLEGETDLS